MTKELKMINEWKVNSVGDVYLFGIKGSGKTCKLLAISQAMYDNGHIKKIWDVFGGDRDEGPFWAFPNRDYNLWNDLESETREFEIEGPKQYKITYAKPLFSKYLPDKLPEDMPNLELKTFTIPFKNIEKKHIACVIGEVGKQAESLWEDLLNDTSKNSNIEDLKFLMNTKYSKMKKTSFYKLFLKPLFDNNFLNSEESELNLNILEEASKKDRIFVLSLDDVPPQFQMFVMSYLITNIYTLVRRNKMYKDHFLLFREASRFMKVVDSDKNREAQCNAFRNILVDMVRYGRTGVWFGMDTQDSCISEDTKIKVVEKGIIKNKKIKDIGKKPKLLSYNFKKKRLEEIEGYNICKGKQEVYEIILEDGRRVLATKEHKFFDLKGKRIYVKNLKKGGELLCQKEFI